MQACVDNISYQKSMRHISLGMSLFSVFYQSISEREILNIELLKHLDILWYKLNAYEYSLWGQLLIGRLSLVFVESHVSGCPPSNWERISQLAENLRRVHSVMKGSDRNSLTGVLSALHIIFTAYCKTKIYSITQCQNLIFRSHSCMQKLYIKFEIYSFLKKGMLTIEGI